MGHLKPLQADALFGVFLQDMWEIRNKYPKVFKNRYYLFEYAEISGDGYGLVIKPDDFPQKIRREITEAFDSRLNDVRKPNRHLHPAGADGCHRQGQPGSGKTARKHSSLR